MANQLDMVLSIEYVPELKTSWCMLSVNDGDILVHHEEWKGTNATELLFAAIQEWFQYSRMYTGDEWGVPDRINEKGWKQLSMFPLPTER